MGCVFSQGTYTFNEEWALTVGVRYANDDKDASETRGGRTDIDADEVNFLITDLRLSPVCGSDQPRYLVAFNAVL